MKAYLITTAANHLKSVKEEIEDKNLSRAELTQSDISIESNITTIEIVKSSSRNVDAIANKILYFNQYVFHSLTFKQIH